MNRTTAWNFYAKFPNGPHVVHFRMGTSGAMSPQLTHPFIATKESELPLKHSGNDSLLFHNGVVTRWRELCYRHNIEIDDNMSDTRALAMMVGIYGPSVINKFGAGGRFILLENGVARLFGKFIYDTGVYFSNDYYKWSRDDYWYNYKYTNKKTYSGYKNPKSFESRYEDYLDKKMSAYSKDKVGYKKDGSFGYIDEDDYYDDYVRGYVPIGTGYSKPAVYSDKPKNSTLSVYKPEEESRVKRYKYVDGEWVDV